MTTISKIPTASLHFDRQNPRLAEYGISKRSTDAEIIETLFEAMDVRELIQSIAASGFFQYEPLIVAVEDSKNVVIEGNRRLAAVKLLLDSKLASEMGYQIPLPSKAVSDSCKSLPVVISNREDAWRALGFKHVNGPAKWSSFAKAKYIAEVHKTYEISLDQIAEQIGDRHRTVQRLYRGLMVLQQAEKKKVFDRADRWLTKFAFSHLYTGIELEGISSFLSLDDENDEKSQPVPLAKLPELGEVMNWLYGSKSKKQPPVVEKQNPNLRELDAVLKSREALAALRADRDLTSALEISRPATAVFEEALLKSKRELTRARGHLTLGFDGSEDLLRIAGTVAELADDIYDEMARKRNPAKKKRLTEE